MRFWFFSIISAMVISCSGTYDLDDIIKAELSSGVRQDSLFLGMSFGMAQQDFYDICTVLNSQRVISQGSEGLSVEYPFDDENKMTVLFNFYPDFDRGKAHRFTGTFHYRAWAPWNKGLQSKDLLILVKEMLHEWYGGNEFKQFGEADKEEWYKVDGNRLIGLSLKDERQVKIIFTDLSHYNILED